jgi:hypothetical protein
MSSWSQVSGRIDVGGSVLSVAAATLIGVLAANAALSAIERHEEDPHMEPHPVVLAGDLGGTRPVIQTTSGQLTAGVSVLGSPGTAGTSGG